MTWDDLCSDKALVCHKEINCDQGGATVHLVVLSDGFLIDCGSGTMGERRAVTLARIINEGGPEKLSHKALEKPIADESPTMDDLEKLADALDYFWNAAIDAAHERQSSTAMDVASVMVQGLAAISARLKEHARAAREASK